MGTALHYHTVVVVCLLAPAALPTAWFSHSASMDPYRGEETVGAGAGLLRHAQLGHAEPRPASLSACACTSWFVCRTDLVLFSQAWAQSSTTTWMPRTMRSAPRTPGPGECFVTWPCAYRVMAEALVFVSQSALCAKCADGDDQRWALPSRWAGLWRLVRTERHPNHPRVRATSTLTQTHCANPFAAG